MSQTWRDVVGYWDHSLCAPVPQPGLADTVDLETLELTPQDLSHTFPLRLPPVSVRPETKHATSSTRMTLATKCYKLDHEPEDEIELALFNVQPCIIPKNHRIFKHAEDAVAEYAIETEQALAARTRRARTTPWKATEAGRTPGDTTVGASTPGDTTIGVLTPVDTAVGGQTPGDTTLDETALEETVDETALEGTALTWTALAEIALAGTAREETLPPEPPLAANPVAEATQARIPQAHRPLFAESSHSLTKSQSAPALNRTSLSNAPRGPKLCIEVCWSNGWSNMCYCAHIFRLRSQFDGSIMAEPISQGIPRMRYPFA